MSINFITGNKFKDLADDYIDESKPFIDLSKKPKIIFLFTDWVDSFKLSVLPKIDYQFKLITHNADMGIYQKDLDLLNDSRLVKWYGMNCHIEHEKLIPIPIGIANSKWPHGDEALLSKVISLNLPKSDRIYCNFDPTTNPIRRDILRTVESNKLVDVEYKKLSQEEYWKKLASYKYVISPPGNSIDCHRIWESLYLGTIPICLKNISLNYFNSLPIIMTDSYQNLQVLEVKTRNFDKCNFTFWKELVYETI